MVVSFKLNTEILPPPPPLPISSLRSETILASFGGRGKGEGEEKSIVDNKFNTRIPKVQLIAVLLRGCVSPLGFLFSALDVAFLIPLHSAESIFDLHL